MSLNQLTFLAQNPFASYATRSGVYTADANGLISNVSLTGTAVEDLMASGCVPITSNPSSNFRNILDGGDFTVNPWQRNCGGLATTGSNTTTIANTVTYFPDRWFGVGGASSSIQLTQIADATVPGFATSCLHSRKNTTTDTAAVNFGQVIEQADAIKCQGSTVTLSFWARTGAFYSGGNLTVQLIAGTGTVANGTAANMVAGSWTSQASLVNVSQPLTGGMTRYNFSAVVPVGATQLGVLFSWTPVGTSGGTTDGIYFNGLQLEMGGLSPFEHRDIQVETEICQRFAWLVAEAASGVLVGMGSCQTTTTATIYMATPVQMRAAPTVTVAAGGFKVSPAAATASGTAAAGSTHTPNAINVTFSSVTTTTAGFATPMLCTSVASNGYVLASADL
jgi:hypothetical protein